MEKQKIVCFYDGGHDYWKIKCDAVYVNDQESVDVWYERHNDVWQEPFENGMEFHAEPGHMFHITDFRSIEVTETSKEEIWHVE